MTNFLKRNITNSDSSNIHGSVIGSPHKNLQPFVSSLQQILFKYVPNKGLDKILKDIAYKVLSIYFCFRFCSTEEICLLHRR